MQSNGHDLSTVAAEERWQMEAINDIGGHGSSSSPTVAFTRAVCFVLYLLGVILCPHTYTNRSGSVTVFGCIRCSGGREFISLLNSFRYFRYVSWNVFLTFLSVCFRQGFFMFFLGFCVVHECSSGNRVFCVRPRTVSIILCFRRCRCCFFDVTFTAVIIADASFTATTTVVTAAMTPSPPCNSSKGTSSDRHIRMAPLLFHTTACASLAWPLCQIYRLVTLTLVWLAPWDLRAWAPPSVFVLFSTTHVVTDHEAPCIASMNMGLDQQYTKSEYQDFMRHTKIKMLHQDFQSYIPRFF